MGAFGRLETGEKGERRLEASLSFLLIGLEAREEVENAHLVFSGTEARLVAGQSQEGIGKCVGSRK